MIMRACEHQRTDYRSPFSPSMMRLSQRSNSDHHWYSLSRLAGPVLFILKCRSLKSESLNCEPFWSTEMPLKGSVFSAHTHTGLRHRVGLLSNLEITHRPFWLLWPEVPQSVHTAPHEVTGKGPEAAGPTRSKLLKDHVLEK